MDQIVLPAKLRTVIGKTVQTRRRQQLLPAVLYGHGLASVNLELDNRVFQQVFRQAGTSSLIDLVVDQRSPVKVLIHDIQRHPTKPEVIHVDFYQVKMTEKLETNIELRFVGEAPAIKELGGILVRAIDRVHVSCLPADLVPSIDIDISPLKTFEDNLKISDIVWPQGLTVMEDAETIVVTVSPPRSEEELKELEGTVTEDVSAVEKVEGETAPEETDESAADDKEPPPTKETKKE